MHILALFVGRTGSSYIWQIFKAFNDVKVYGEVLTTPKKFLKPLNAKEKLRLNEDELDKFAKENLLEYFKFLEKESNEPNFFTKISLVQIAKLIKEQSPILTKILLDPNTKILIIERNLVDTYISLKKVKLTKTWRNTDTTDLRIKVDIDDFLTYYNRISLLYQKLYNILNSHDKSYLTIKYDDMHDFERDSELLFNGQDLNMYKTKYIQRQIKKIGLEFDINPDNFKKIPFMPQQDKNQRIIQKVRNFRDFRHSLKKKGLVHLLT